MPPTPDFSVYIPAYNRAEFLGQTIESVLNQTLEDFELIIIDDCSTDNTKEVVHSYKDKRIRYYFNEKNLGCVASHNKALTLARGTYIQSVDSDDLISPTLLEKEERVFRENPEVGLVYCDGNLIDAAGNILEKSYWESEGYNPIRGRLNSEMIACCGLVMLTFVFRREVLEKVGCQNASLTHPHDGEYCLRIAAEFEVEYIPEALYNWRIHPGGRHEARDEKMYIERAMVIKEISARYPWAISETFKKICIANNFCQGGLFLSKKNEFKRARTLFEEAIKECPYHPLALLWYLNTYTKIETLWDLEAPKKHFLKLLHILGEYRQNVGVPSKRDTPQRKNNQLSPRQDAVPIRPIKGESPLKIIHIIDHLGAGGAQKLLVELVKHIDREKYNISIIILKNKNIHSMVLQELGASVYPVSSSKYSIGIKRLTTILQKEHPHIVHTHLFKANLLGQYAAKKLGVSRIAHIHSIFNPHALLPSFFQSQILLSLYLFLLRQVLRGTTRIITASKSGRKFLIECWGLQPAQVLYLPNGVSLEPFTEIQKDRQKYREKVRALAGIKEEVPVIGMVGRFSKEKNWPLFFKTAAAIKEKLPESIFWAVGEGKELSFCKKLVKKLGLESSVHFWGYRRDVPEIYCGMDCFLFTSVLDSFGLVIVEAMLSMVPVVAMGSEAAESIITPMQNGILLDSLNPELIAKATLELLQDKKLQTRIIAQGYEDCSKKFTINHWVAFMSNLYNELGRAASSESILS